MSEVEKQESQKTVVAFISGLLIGGLLVWVFSSTPENAIAPEQMDTNTTEEVTDKKVVPVTATEETKEIVGKGSVIVNAQSAGDAVVLSTLELPTKNGWVVVREFNDGVTGNILGAARYSVEEGLIPTTVELMRGTTAGQTYQVVFFTNEGDSSFSLEDDTMIDGIAATFKAN